MSYCSVAYSKFIVIIIPLFLQSHVLYRKLQTVICTTQVLILTPCISADKADLSTVRMAAAVTSTESRWKIRASASQRHSWQTHQSQLVTHNKTDFTCYSHRLSTQIILLYCTRDCLLPCQKQEKVEKYNQSGVNAAVVWQTDATPRCSAQCTPVLQAYT